MPENWTSYLEDLPEIANAVKAQHYHVACTKVFEVTHGLSRGQGLDGESVNHPNQYAAKSRDLEKSKKDGTKEIVKKEDDADAMVE